MKSILTFLVFFSLPLASLQGQSNRDISEVLQKCIDYEDIQKFYQVEKYPTRLPLIILNDSIIPFSVGLWKFGKPVNIMTKSMAFQLGYNSRDHCPFEITKFNITDIEGVAEFEYTPESIMIYFWFVKKDNSWNITKTQFKKK